MNEQKELRPEQIKEIFRRAASVETAPDVNKMLRRQSPWPIQYRAWLLPAFAVAAVGLLVVFTSVNEKPTQTILRPVDYTNNTANIAPAGSLNPPTNTPTSLLNQAKQAAARRDFATAAKLAQMAGDEALAERYYNESSAQEFLPLCEEATKAKKGDDIFTYCYEALRDLTETETYKGATATINTAKGAYKTIVFTETKTLLDKAEAINNSGTKDIKQLGNAKSLANKASDKLDNVEKFSGKDSELIALAARGNVMLSKLMSIKAECDESACVAKGGQCSANGTCVAMAIACPSTCASGCKPKTNICKDVTSSKCDPSTCKGTCIGDACEASAASTKINAEDVKSKLAMPDGCSSVSIEEFNILKASSKSDYYFFKAYCARDANPGKACAYYKDFLKVAPSDGRKGQAVAFIKSQDPTAYEECKIE